MQLFEEWLHHARLIMPRVYGSAPWLARKMLYGFSLHHSDVMPVALPKPIANIDLHVR
ncbi:hypothetical protein RM533_03390 [Croceicoccus sp. F390]|uniref:Uncharacterized protein n=1 Tax=Croceicoccus esteveae TaxID=3075597 RepID=A0ABU2ZG77_9SPHN|nr:hypothetical protein [Croceicoccus sp. F390]MDT0575226.1 hypothetical protein [Croceicoccus sp. F390]